MTSHILTFPPAMLRLFALAEDAIHQIPPAFALDATVAVNPFLGQTAEDKATAAARLARVAGVPLGRPRSELSAMIAEGRISGDDLKAAAGRFGLSEAELGNAARHAPAPAKPDPTVADLAKSASGTDWPGHIADRVGLWAAAHFDKGQALWPALDGTAYASWKAFAKRDLTPGIFGLPGFCTMVADLPSDPRAAFAQACAALGLTPEAAPLYFHRLLMTLGGWAQYARGLGWTAERDGGHESTAFELLTIRLVWDAGLLLADTGLGPAWDRVRSRWEAPLVPGRETLIDLALQEAADLAGERALSAMLSDGARGPQHARPALQAAFCIDVRSETLRRAIEAVEPEAETLGFAGFFGLPVAHRGAASDTVEARAPMLVAPALDSASSMSVAADTAQRLQQRAVRAWGRFKLAAVSSFAFVESAGPLYAVKLVKAALGKAAQADATGPAPVLDLPLDRRVHHAGQILRAMSLTDGFARLVLIAGHGSTVTNAPHASALQCGACGGHAGDVNARLLAGLLNDPVVRSGLAETGLTIPEDTHFVAGLHDTLTDRVTLFDDSPRASHADDIARLGAVLEQAGELARTERAATLPRAGTGDALPRRGGDWSELRPEWGLAGCRAFIAAPRHRTRGRDLGGRVFLHSYDWQQDDGFAVLEQILTAPVVVASWIGLQYHGSSVAPEAFGAGNKLLHNVVGGIGVVEGSGGILRAGLPWQSVHDGEAPRHEPLRLSVAVEAPRSAILDVLNRHAGLKALFDNGWLSLHALDAAGRMAWRYDGGGWVGAKATTPEAKVCAA